MVYVFAQLFGSVVAAAMVLPLYGFGQFGSLFDTRIFGFLGLSVPPHLRSQARSCWRQMLSKPCMEPAATYGIRHSACPR